MDKVTRAVRDVVLTPTESIDTAKAETMVSQLIPRPDLYQSIFEAIRSLASSSSRRDRVKCFGLVDYLFSHAPREFLIELQNSPAIRGLSADDIMIDPHVHRALAKLSANWITACQTKTCLIPRFLDWQQSVQNYRYRRGLSLDWANRFNFDFSAAIELIAIFHNAIVAAYKEKGGPEDALLKEVYARVTAASQKLQAVKPTVPDLAVIRLITYVEDYIALCNRQYAAYVQTLNIDLIALGDMAKKELPQPSIGYQKAFADQPPVTRQRASTLRPMPTQMGPQQRPGPPGPEAYGQFQAPPPPRPMPFQQSAPVLMGQPFQQGAGPYQQGPQPGFQQGPPGGYPQAPQPGFQQGAPTNFQQAAQGSFVQGSPGGFQQGPPGGFQQNPAPPFQQGPQSPYQQTPLPQGPPVTFQQGSPGNLQQGPPGTFQQGPPGNFQQGPPGSFQQGPPGRFQQGPPGNFQQGAPGNFQQGPPGGFQQGPPGNLQQGPAGNFQHGPTLNANSQNARSNPVLVYQSPGQQASPGNIQFQQQQQQQQYAPYPAGQTAAQFAAAQQDSFGMFPSGPIPRAPPDAIEVPQGRKVAVRQRPMPEGPPMRKRARAKTMQPGEVKQFAAAMAAERSRAGNQFADFEFADDLDDK
jgi:hypothetical protein